MDERKVRMTAQRMTQARAVLVKENPFFGRLAMGLDFACAPCGTACTDGSRLIFDPEFAQKLSEKEIEFVMIHEVLHCVLEHCARGKGLNQLVYNIACDTVVNSTILGMWGMETFEVCNEVPVHIAPDGKEGRLHSAEEIYQMLMKKSEGTANGSGGRSWSAISGVSIDRHDLWNGIANPNQLKDEWNMKITQALKTCGDTSEMPQSIRKLAEKLSRRSRTDWRQLLHDFLQFDDYDYSYLPPDCRYMDFDFFMPAYNVDVENGHAGDIWVCVDTSGSISDEELSQAIFEVGDAMRQAGLGGKISFFDSVVSTPAPLETEEEFRKIKPTGGGGTSFYAVFGYMKEHMYPDLPKAILIFTDGYAPYPPDEMAMNVPVLWLISRKGKTDAPWGTVARL